MSTATRIPLSEAQEIAASLLPLLAPCCERLEIAGSVRRKSADCGDLELVAIPPPGIPMATVDLFGDPVAPPSVEDQLTTRCKELRASGVLSDRLDKLGHAAFGARYKRLVYRGLALDLFSCLYPAQFGVLYLIRTGPADFSHAAVTTRGQRFVGHTGNGHGLGLLPPGHQVRDGGVYAFGSDVALPMPEETDFFAFLGLDFVPPEERR